MRDESKGKSGDREGHMTGLREARAGQAGAWKQLLWARAVALKLGRQLRPDIKAEPHFTAVLSFATLSPSLVLCGHVSFSAYSLALVLLLADVDVSLHYYDLALIFIS